MMNIKHQWGSTITCALLLSITNLVFASQARAEALTCDTDTCYLTLSPAIQITAGVGNITNDVNAGRFEIQGDIVFRGGEMLLPMADAQLVLQLDNSSGKLLEFYGSAALPLDEWEIFHELELEASPPLAVFGLFQQDTVEDMFNYTLPLNSAISTAGTQRESDQPYLVFHTSSGGLRYDLNKKFGLGLAEDSSLAIEIAEEETFTFALDLHDPYIFLGQGFTLSVKTLQDGKQKLAPITTYLPITTEIKNDYGEIETEITEYYDNDGKLVTKYVHNLSSSTISKQDIDPYGHTTVSFYQQDADGDFVREGTDKNQGDYFNTNELANGIDTNNRQRNRSANDPDKKKKRRDFDIGVDAIGYSLNGWMGFEAEQTFGIPEHAHGFSGNVYLQGAIPLNPAVTLEGQLMAYLGEAGLILGGNGNIAFAPAGLPDIIDFSLYLGGASTTLSLTSGDQLAFISGLMQPDTALFEQILPISPSGEVKVAGYVDSNFAESQLLLEGNYAIGARKLGELIGVELSELNSVQGNAMLSPIGFSLKGTTTNQIHPDIKFSSQTTVEVDISFLDPSDFRLKLMGAADVFGVGLEEVSVEINGIGMFINGVFVTPITRMAMMGAVDKFGPSLTGTASIGLDLGDITGSLRAAYDDLNAAQAEVNRLNTLIASERKKVEAGRAEHAKKLQSQRAVLTAAQNEVNRLNSAIDREYRGISYQRSKISAKYRWYKKAKWYQRAGRWASYNSERAWRNAVIAKHYTAIGALNVAKRAAMVALDAAKLALIGLERLTEVTPIDLDPKVAPLIAARDIANVALEAAKLPLKDIPVIDHSFAGEISATIDISGIYGTVNATFDGYSALSGDLSFDPEPKACIKIPGFGEACAAF